MSSRLDGPVIIIGGGPTGLGAAYALHQAGFDDWLLLEREDEVGGLSRSFRDGSGFTWDIGCHVIFSHYDEFIGLLDDLLPCDGWLYHRRESWIRVLDRWVPYPFQNNIHRLPPAECAACLDGLIRAAAARSNRPFANFGEFIDRTFGTGIARLFMHPYNRKVWAYQPEQLDAGWIAERVSVPDPARVARNVAAQADDVDWGPNNRFRFPRTGGTGAIWLALRARLPDRNVLLSREAVQLDAQARRIRFSDGSEYCYGALISTMPVDRLAAISGRRDWIELAAGLRRSAVHIVGVALTGRPSAGVRNKCWMYFPAEQVPFYRVTHFSHYSPNNVDDISLHWSLMAESSESPAKPLDERTIVQQTVRGLIDTELVADEKQVLHTWIHRAEYGYPTPSLQRNAVLRELLPQLAQEGILSRGRFGAWLYEVGNMDHSFMQGIEAARSLLDGSPERVLHGTHVLDGRSSAP